MIKDLLRSWAKRTLFADEAGQRELATETIAAGKSTEERLAFWQGLHEMFRSEPGRAYQAFMQREFARIQGDLLAETTPVEKRAELIAKLQQQAFVVEYPALVERNFLKKLKELEERSNS